ncbi:MAG: DUF5056 domain-containing protein [Bacteroidales bacterium]|nr:DUF5056 domain-containing protein [Bacteroidales bacterium]
MMDKPDKEITRLFKQDLPQAGRDPWFTRRVMNRLPRRQQRMSPVEVACIIAVCLLIVTAFIIEGTMIISSQQILVRDVVIMSTLTMMSLGVGGWIISPYLKN